ncbi:hypothetical protein H257_17102 [Aphanomyces astaci]|uniref:Uncharacterized protein n=1 Tax=Aphanomyces astaci TaxID=112090 RepID=W4FHU6_APHAT|nr:hypothetical protein H257_17102 [Aphanomyces astaci]ETV66434.1 hypothetical protein H257_17102 [Aphanomyces astaci]|eukprot:XP_009844068.1 hypothetical protein H257_17102 [Aphanomyces astaci]
MNATSFIIARCILGTIRLPRPAHYSAYRARIFSERIIVGGAALSSVPPPEARALPQTMHELCKTVVGRWSDAAKRSKLRPPCMPANRFTSTRVTAFDRLGQPHAAGIHSIMIWTDCCGKV